MKMSLRVRQIALLISLLCSWFVYEKLFDKIIGLNCTYQGEKVNPYARIYFSIGSGESYSCSLGKRICTLNPQELIETSGAEKTITQIKKSTINKFIYEAHIISNTYNQNLSDIGLTDIKFKVDLSTMNAQRTLFMKGRGLFTIDKILPGKCKKVFETRKFIFSNNAYF